MSRLASEQRGGPRMRSWRAAWKPTSEPSPKRPGTRPRSVRGGRCPASAAEANFAKALRRGGRILHKDQREPAPDRPRHAAAAARSCSPRSRVSHEDFVKERGDDPTVRLVSASAFLRCRKDPCRTGRVRDSPRNPSRRPRALFEACPGEPGGAPTVARPGRIAGSGRSVMTRRSRFGERLILPGQRPRFQRELAEARYR